ncbi:hypothetical protein GCM10010965_14690 [Caldalkalibacillus thermarum]|uniref:hypothetical protein n=1 Tax=Caldalkalibacillus thermarum TaxID=296745 RepID=UPI00166EDE02|nr:hypothetical protein [Caldalkalibacillus thermarum]GGK22869.1 hypothetical protein GCM10010965_14690 [Caldalkalibacillus thermarum]
MKKGLVFAMFTLLMLAGCVVAEAGGEEASENGRLSDEYFQFLDTNFAHVTETLEQINALSQEQRPRDENWTMQIAVEFVKLEQYIKEVKEYRQVPMRFTAFHKKYVETLEVFHDSVWTLIATDQRKRPQNAVVGEISREILDRKNEEK